jgi:hypothetical protein
MPNNSSDNLDDQEVTAEPFTALLAFLSTEDPNEAHNHYLRLHQKLAGYFRLKGMADPVTDADDALDRAGKKILEGVPIPDIDRFCMGIARNVVLERSRNKRREESAFLHFFEHSQNDNALIDRITNLMKPCFESLEPDDRDVLNSYCKVPAGKSRAEHRRALAESLKSTIAALRIRVTRLRRELENCVKALSKNR